MAGSKKWFVYTDDLAREWAINMDESNGEAVSNPDYTDTDLTILDELPRNIKPRIAIYRSLDARFTRRIVVCDGTETVLTLPGTITVQDGSGGTVSAILTTFQGEKRTRIPFDTDTGINDGDAT